ncbi:MAG: TetR/AcrR family transcriptional regulator [Chloroflexota bacterium]
MTRKDEILQAARDVLIEEGHYRLTLRNVAERVGIKLASLQYHFPSKGNLVSQLMRVSVAGYQEIMRELTYSIVANEESSAIERLFSVYQDEQASGVFEQLWALSVQDPQLKAQYEASYLDLWSTIGDIIRQFDPEATDDECRTRAAMIIALLDGLETFVGAEPLQSLVPASLPIHVVTLIKNVAQGGYDA